MDLSIIKNKLLGIIFIFFLFLFLTPNIAHGYYDLCGTPCNASYTCNAPYVCFSSICLRACDPNQCGEYRGCPNTYCPCSSFAPLAPTNFNLNIVNTTPDLPIVVNFTWSFLGGTQDCGIANGWGKNCAGNSNNFRLEDSGVALTTTATLTSSSRTATVNFKTWGNHSIRVCASNDNFATTTLKTCSAAINPTFISPTPYPTVVITGTLKQNSNSISAECQTASAEKFFKLSKLNIIPASTQCITPICSGKESNDKASGFSCNIKFDNIQCQLTNNYLRPTPNQSFKLDAIAIDYDSYETAGKWDRSNPDPKICFPIEYLEVSAINPTPIKQNIYFNYNSRWIKIKDSSYSTTSPTQNNRIPAVPQAFDSEDTGTLDFINQSNVNAAGVVFGLNIGSYGKYSVNNWGNSNYTSLSQKFSSNNTFLDYLKSKKEYKTIASLSELSTGINLIDNDVEINDTNKDYFNNYNSILFLLNNHTLTFNLTSFAPNKSIMFIATNIYINSDVKTIGEINTGTILIADNITVFNNPNSGNGLKIYGNFISRSQIENYRDNTDNSKPSIFIIFRVKSYLDLLPYLSSSIYDWKQTQ